jgi:hypothetical protein
MQGGASTPTHLVCAWALVKPCFPGPAVLAIRECNPLGSLKAHSRLTQGSLQAQVQLTMLIAHPSPGRTTPDLAEKKIVGGPFDAGMQVPKTAKALFGSDGESTV